MNKQKGKQSLTSKSDKKSYLQILDLFLFLDCLAKDKIIVFID